MASPSLQQKHRVLFVCLGNACRSPIAEAIARSIANNVIEPASAGLYPLGRLPEATEQILRANGYSIEGLSSKPLTLEAVQLADHVVNMSGEDIDLHLPRNSPEAVRLARKMEVWDVQDPYGEDTATYQRILEHLESRIVLLAARLRTGEWALKT
jgi:arsenate reductase (thioredoxin)